MVEPERLPFDRAEASEVTFRGFPVPVVLVAKGPFEGNDADQVQEPAEERFIAAGEPCPPGHRPGPGGRQQASLPDVAVIEALFLALLAVAHRPDE